MKHLNKILLLFVLLLVNNINSQSKNLKAKNILSIKKSFYNTLLTENNNSLVFDQSKPSSNLFNNNFSDYNISYHRKINSRLFLGVDYYDFNSYNEINPVSLSLSPVLERNKFISKTESQQIRISGFYDILVRNKFIIRAGLYIPFFNSSKVDLTLIYQDEMNQNSLFLESVSTNENKFYFGIVDSEISIDFLYDLNFLEAGISTSWHSSISRNDPIMRFSAVLNIYL